MTKHQGFEWRGNTLLGTGRKQLLYIVPDAKWPGMFRLEHDGKRSDLLNRTRAKDLAMLIAKKIEIAGSECPPEAPGTSVVSQAGGGPHP